MPLTNLFIGHASSYAVSVNWRVTPFNSLRRPQSSPQLFIEPEVGDPNNLQPLGKE